MTRTADTLSRQVLTATAPADVAPLTVLDPHETAVDLTLQPPPSDVDQYADLPEVTFRHSGWQRHRAAIARAMRSAGLSADRVNRFNLCGAYAWVLRRKDDPTCYRIGASYCRDRFCLPCQHDRAYRLSAVIDDQLPACRLLLVTLTLRHSPLPLICQLNALYRSFRRLRQRKLWTSRVTGGAAFLEVKRSNDRHHWHPHLHLIVQADWIPHSELAMNWRAVTRTSFVVHVRLIRDPDRVRRYVTRYAAKPMSYAPTNSPELLTEALAALQGRRLVFCFGSWRRFRLTDDYQPHEWTPVCPLREVIQRAAAFDPWASAILETFRRQLPWDRTDKLKHAAD